MVWCVACGKNMTTRHATYPPAVPVVERAAEEGSGGDLANRPLDLLDNLDPCTSLQVATWVAVGHHRPCVHEVVEEPNQEGEQSPISLICSADLLGI